MPRQESKDPLVLSIIIVNWNLRDLLMDCLASVQKEMRLGSDQYEIIVVDNASTDGSVQMGRERFPDVQWVESLHNLGFAAGCNVGFRRCRGRFILLLNPDTVVLDHAIDRMLAELEQRPKAAILGSRLVNDDRSFQRAAGGAFPTPANVAWNYFFLNRLLPSSLAPAPLFLEGDPQGVMALDWVSGAAMLVRREALGSAIFNESFFLFGEDMDLCERMRRQGWHVLYTSETTVLHYHGQSYQKQSSMEVLDTAVKGPREFFKRQHSRGELLLYDLILLIGYTLRSVLFGLLAALRPGRGYGSLSSFSRRYAFTMLRLLFEQRPSPSKRADGAAAVPMIPEGGSTLPGAPPAAVAPVPKFSIIMNIFNGEAYLAEAIESVRAQTFTDWELICWDDCSTDRSAEICARYADPRIRYYLAPSHTSIGEARNAGIHCARSAWLAFLDQDDLWAPTKLAQQYALIEQDTSGKLGIVYGRTMQLSLRGRQRDFDRWHEFSPLPEGDIFGELITKPSFVSLSSAVLLREAVQQLGPIPAQISYCPDYYLFVMVAKNYHAACLQQTCCWYRVHATNMSHIYKIPIHHEILRIIESCSGLVGAKTLARRHKVHQTLIGVEEILSGSAPRNGIVRILRQGSVAYLLIRACLNTYRSVRRVVHSV